jgi:outer membrane receptor protein involved in Fe transport
MSSHRAPPFRRSPLVAGLLLALSTSAYCVAASAQSVPRPPTPDDAGQVDEGELDTIIVTGSRIRRAGFDTLEPATVVDREYIDARGITNVADALNEIPGFGVGITPEGGQSGFGVGVNFVDRFGLGSNRTLTLVNGRRFVSSNGVTLFGPAAPGIQVDLNAIPTSMVQRVENLAIGGAPTYGSDAISGVVNVLLRKDYEGIEFGTTYGITGRGDNARQSAYALFGKNFGTDSRGNVTVSVSYDKVEGVLQKDRDFFADGYFNTTNPLASQLAQFPGRTPGNDGRFNPNIPFNTGATDGIPNGVLIRDRRIWTTPFGGLISPVSGPFAAGSFNLRPAGFGPGGNTVLGFNRNGELVPYNPGSTFSATDASGGDGLDLVEAGQITSDLERKSVLTTARWALNDSVDLFFEGSFYSADSLELVDQYTFNSPLFGGLSAMIRFPSTHPLLTAQAQSTLAGLGVTSFNLSRASRDLVTNNGRGETELGRGVIGLEGTFELGERLFYWEASYNYGRSDSRSFGTSLVQQNFINALNVTRDAQGQLVCAGVAIPGLVIPGGNTPVADPNCVPLDIFGEGRPSAAARSYVTTQTEAQGLLEQEVFNANLSGTAVELWSGPLLFNVGYERRKESGLFDPGEFARIGLGRAVPIPPLQGSYTTDEFFGEVIVPLVNPNSEIPGLGKLDLVGKFRTVDNTFNGRANTYTYGLQWKPINDLEIRGNFTRAIRAPAITELFLPRSSSFQFVTGDPCDSRFINAGGSRQAQRTRNCQAFLGFYGLTSFTSNAAGASIQGISGGNPNLDNETSDSLTYGFTWAPSFLKGLTVAADYYRIELENVISNLTATQLASGCFDSDDFDTTDIPNANAFCSQIVRNAPGSATPGQATTFTSGFVNGKFFDFEGYSAEVRYQFDTDRFGKFVFGFAGFFPKELTIDNTGVSPNPAVDEIGTSKRQYQLSGAWERGKLGLNLSGNYQSSAAFNVLNTPETRDILRVDSYWLFNGGASYAFSDDLRLRLAVTNLFDEEPPFPGFGAGIGNYDILGRRYSLSLQWKFK